MLIALLLSWMLWQGKPQKLNVHPHVAKSAASQAQQGGWSEWRCAGCAVEPPQYIPAGMRCSVEDSEGHVKEVSCFTPPKKHRWLPHPIDIRNLETGKTAAQWDICLEHGETRVREWK